MSTSSKQVLEESKEVSSSPPGAGLAPSPPVGANGSFSMQGVPKFGKNWLDNFIPNEEMQNTFITSEVVRNVLML